jgi:plasmid stabilization system protein ParE
VRVTFNELAERELNDAAHFYEYEQSGLGEAFIDEIRRCADAIAEHPEAGPIVLGIVRRRLCARFPYARLYSNKGDEIRVLAVMNLKRRPGYWVGRS